MKLLLAVIGMSVLSLSSFNANAGDGKTKTFTTEEYCLLVKAGEQKGILKAYGKKLGQVPSKATCRSFNEFVKKAQPKDWDYKGGKPYPGSALRLSASQIEKLKKAKD